MLRSSWCLVFGLNPTSNEPRPLCWKDVLACDTHTTHPTRLIDPLQYELRLAIALSPWLLLDENSLTFTNDGFIRSLGFGQRRARPAP